MSYLSPFFPHRISPLRTFCDGVGPLVLVVIIIIKYNYRTRDLFYTNFTVERNTRRRGFGYKVQISSVYAVCLELILVRWFWTGLIL